MLNSNYLLQMHGDKKIMLNNNSVHMNMFSQALNLLAAHYEQQVKTFPNFVHIPDEIALVFDDVYVFVDEFLHSGIITISQKAEIDTMHTLLNQMSEKQEMWTLKALEISSQWEMVRVTAKKILKSLNEEPHFPHLFWIQYMPDDNQRD